MTGVIDDMGNYKKACRFIDTGVADYNDLHSDDQQQEC